MSGNREFSSKRFRELVLLLTTRSKDDLWFGATKLNKTLYYCDFVAYRRIGKSLTGATYVKLSEGPAPKQLLQERETMLQAGEITLELRQVFNYLQQRLVPLKKHDMKTFDEVEKSIVDEIVELLRPMSARQVSEMSHQEIGWKASELGEEIPYETAFLSAEPVSASHELRTIAGIR